MSEITADRLVIGDIITDGKSVVVVKKLEMCPGSVKGVPRVHVNGSDCYDTITVIDVERGNEDVSSDEIFRDESRGLPEGMGAPRGKRPRPAKNRNRKWKSHVLN